MLKPWQRDRISQVTNCSAAVRIRPGWGQRMLTISGPANKIMEAKQLARAYVAENELGDGTDFFDNNGGGDGGGNGGGGGGKGWAPIALQVSHRVWPQNFYPQQFMAPPPMQYPFTPQQFIPPMPPMPMPPPMQQMQQMQQMHFGYMMPPAPPPPPQARTVVKEEVVEVEEEAEAPRPVLPPAPPHRRRL